MRRFASPIGLFVMVFAMTASAAQTPATAVCERIATLIRSVPQGDPWEVLTKGTSPFIQMMGDSEMKALGFDRDLEPAELVNRFVAKFSPSDALRKAWADNIKNGYIDINALAGSDLHVVTNTGGTAQCLGFMFFQAPKGRQAQLLPDLPKKGDRDGENLICNKTGGDGYLARVGGIEAFLETYQNEKGLYYRVVPIQNARWGAACAVEAEYGTSYKASKVFVPNSGLVAESDLKAVAPQLVERRDAVKEAKEFSFGPPLTEREKEAVRTMTDLVALAVKMDGEPVPTFGKGPELDSGEEKLKVDVHSFPLVLNGRAVLLRMGTGQLGCCYFPGPILILYSLQDGKPEAVGSAIVEKGRGVLKSVKATVSR